MRKINATGQIKWRGMYNIKMCSQYYIVIITLSSNWKVYKVYRWLKEITFNPHNNECNSITKSMKRKNNQAQAYDATWRNVKVITLLTQYRKVSF
jgi:hypothetical protein